MERIKDSNGHGKGKIRCAKLVSFFIKDITGPGYSIKLITEMIKLMKTLLRLNQPEKTRRIRIIAKLTLDILNFVGFLLIID